MSFLEVFFTIFALIGNIGVGIFTLIKNPKNATNKLVFIFTWVLAVYIVVNYLSLTQVTSEATFFWVKMIISIATVVNLVYFLLAQTFPDKNIKTSKTILIASSVFTLIVITATQFNLVFQNIIVHSANTESVPGPGMPLFLLHTVLLLGGGFASLVSKYKKSIGLVKTQTKLFLLATITMFISILTTNLLFVLLFDTSKFIQLLPIYALMFVTIISYAIVKHRFLDIRLIIIRYITYIVLLVVFGFLYALNIFIAAEYLFPQIYESNRLLFTSILALLFLFTFQPLRRFLEKQTSHIFYKNRYSPSKVFIEINKIMASNINLSLLSDLVLKQFLNSINASSAIVMLINKNKITWVKGAGDIVPPLEFDEIEINTLLQYTLSDELEENILVFEELEESDLKSIMRKNNLSVFIPLVVKDEVVGALSLGQKSSGEVYTVEDIEMFKILAPEFAIAIQNAKSYDEQLRFNLTLEQEVENATRNLKRANERLKQLDHLKDEFVSIASHELRTPMTVIKSYLWMLLQGKAGKLTNKQKEYVERSFDSTERLINLVNDMLNSSRIASGRIQLKRVGVDLVELTKKVVEGMIPRAEELDIKLQFDELKKDIPHAFADPEKIEQVLINLIGNSLKFTPNGGKVNVSVTQNNEKKVVVAVKDTGIGLKKEDMSKLFHRFSSIGGRYMNKTAQSTGLGLYLSKNIIKLHKGKMWAESEGEGRGSTFSFSLESYEKGKESEKVSSKDQQEKEAKK